MVVIVVCRSVVIATVMLTIASTNSLINIPTPIIGVNVTYETLLAAIGANELLWSLTSNLTALKLKTKISIPRMCGGDPQPRR